MKRKSLLTVLATASMLAVTPRISVFGADEATEDLAINISIGLPCEVNYRERTTQRNSLADGILERIYAANSEYSHAQVRRAVEYLVQSGQAVRYGKGTKREPYIYALRRCIHG